MRVPYEQVEERRRKLAELLQRHSYLPVQEVCKRLGVSEATARRDLAALEKDRKIIRTFGGALSEFNQRFTSFSERRGKGAAGKRFIAEKAVSYLRGGMLVYMDSGTTVHAVAERMSLGEPLPLTVVTNNLPVAELLSKRDGISIFLLGGEFLGRQSVLLGDQSLEGLRAYEFDLAFLGAEGMTGRGIFNSTETIVEMQKLAVLRSGRSVFCIDSGKLGHEAPVFMLEWGEVGVLITDATVSALREAGVRLPSSRLRCRKDEAGVRAAG